MGNPFQKIVLSLLAAAALGSATTLARAQGEESVPALPVENLSPVPGNASREYIVISGGPALREWEKLKKHSHDHTWANFINASVVRWEQIHKVSKAGDKLTWMVYRTGYERRGKEDNANEIGAIENKAKALGVHVKWFRSGGELIDYINNGYPRDSVKIANLDYFGHSNKYCWMFDYSNSIDGCSWAYLHVKDMPGLRYGSFVQNAKVWSWGCHSAEAFCQDWERYTGSHMVGTVGKTDYSTGGLPVVTRAPGWVY